MDVRGDQQDAVRGGRRRPARAQTRSSSIPTQVGSVPSQGRWRPAASRSTQPRRLIVPCADRASISTTGCRRQSFNGAMSYVTGSHNSSRLRRCSAATSGAVTTTTPRAASGTRQRRDCARVRDDPGAGLRLSEQPQLQPGHLRAGSLDDEPADAERRHPSRHAERVHRAVHARSRTWAAEPQHRTSGRSKNVPNWKDINPRVSAAYDLFGNGKTALKAQREPRRSSRTRSATASANNPAATIQTQTARIWTDSNGNHVPDCNLLNLLRRTRRLLAETVRRLADSRLRHCGARHRLLTRRS